MIKLSVLVCTVIDRRKTFLPKILDQLHAQYEKLHVLDQRRVEILYLGDNKQMMLGDKRNLMVDMAQGDYVVFVDDDDRLEDHYLHELLVATNTNADCINFLVSVSINGNAPKNCKYSRLFEGDHNTEEGYFRLPNHICCVKKEVSQMVAFPNIKYGEDSAYSKLLKPFLKSEHQINMVLYHYDYNELTTVAQEDRPTVQRRMRNARKAVVDVVILSNAKNRVLRQMTENTIRTCINGAGGVKLNVTVVEQQQGIVYNNTFTRHQAGEFNYNEFANIGAKNGLARWILICNNDLEFQPGWLQPLLLANWPVMSPKDYGDHRQADVKGNETGYENGKYLSGWCFMIQRALWEMMGGFDPDFPFWCADDSLIEQLRFRGIEPMLVPGSRVDHIRSRTLLTVSDHLRDELTWGGVYRFNKKYGQAKFANHPRYQHYVKNMLAT